MSVVVEPSGAQVLPHVGDSRARLSGWQALCAANADERAKSQVWREIASLLIVKRGA